MPSSPTFGINQTLLLNTPQPLTAHRMYPSERDNETGLIPSILWLVHLLSPSLFTLLHKVAKKPLPLVTPVFSL
jgi:hypothetical protein